MSERTTRRNRRRAEPGARHRTRPGAGTPAAGQTTAPAAGPDAATRQELPSGAAGEDHLERAGDRAAGWPGRYPVTRRIAPVALGVVCVVLSLQLPMGTATRPGPGLWPLLCGLLILVAGALAWTSPPADDEQPFSRRSWLVLAAAASLGAFTFAMPLVGFELAMVVLLAFWLKVLGGEGWRTTAVVSVAATAAFYLLFVTALGLNLPRLF